MSLVIRESRVYNHTNIYLSCAGILPSHCRIHQPLLVEVDFQSSHYVQFLDVQRLTISINELIGNARKYLGGFGIPVCFTVQFGSLQSLILIQ